MMEQRSAYSSTQGFDRRWILHISLIVLLVVGLLFVFYIFKRNRVTVQENYEKYLGLWVNADPRAEGITRLSVETIRGDLSIHAWGRCVPVDCDWGKRIVDISGDGGRVEWDQGSLNVKMAISSCPDGLLVVTHNFLPDGRDLYLEKDHFVRKK
jgi:hypothetical protein